MAVPIGVQAGGWSPQMIQGARPNTPWSQMSNWDRMNTNPNPMYKDWRKFPPGGIGQPTGPQPSPPPGGGGGGGMIPGVQPRVPGATTGSYPRGGMDWYSQLRGNPGARVGGMQQGGYGGGMSPNGANWGYGGGMQQPGAQMQQPGMQGSGVQAPTGGQSGTGSGIYNYNDYLKRTGQKTDAGPQWTEPDFMFENRGGNQIAPMLPPTPPPAGMTSGPTGGGSQNPGMKPPGFDWTQGPTGGGSQNPGMNLPPRKPPGGTWATGLSDEPAGGGGTYNPGFNNGAPNQGKGGPPTVVSGGGNNPYGLPSNYGPSNRPAGGGVSPRQISPREQQLINQAAVRPTTPVNTQFASPGATTPQELARMQALEKQGLSPQKMNWAQMAEQGWM